MNEINAEPPHWFSGPLEENPAHLEKQAKRAEARERIYLETLAEPDQKATQARDLLETKRAKFVRRGQLDLKASR